MQRGLLIPFVEALRYWQLTISSLPVRREENRSDDFSPQSVLERVGSKGYLSIFRLNPLSRVQHAWFQAYLGYVGQTTSTSKSPKSELQVRSENI